MINIFDCIENADNCLL